MNSHGGGSQSRDGGQRRDRGPGYGGQRRDRDRGPGYGGQRRDRDRSPGYGGQRRDRDRSPGYGGQRRDRGPGYGGQRRDRGPPIGTGPRGVFYVRGTQAMYTALEVLERLGREGRLVLKARGQSIPTAVAVANIITDRLVQGSSRVENVQVDSEEIRELGGVMSTIEITLSKTGA